MKMFDSVVIACPTTYLDGGLAIRSALEWFRLRVHFYHCVQKQNVLDFLTGGIPSSDYVVMVSGGLICADADGGNANEMAMGFPGLVDLVDGKWQAADFWLTPGDIPELVNLKGQTIISLGCGSGREPFAKAFLDSGCKAYIGPVGEVDQDATVMFTTALFYHLLSPERAGSGPCSDEEAVRRAASVDTLCREGTHLFRYYTRDHSLVGIGNGV